MYTTANTLHGTSASKWLIHTRELEAWLKKCMVASVKLTAPLAVGKLLISLTTLLTDYSLAHRPLCSLGTYKYMHVYNVCG